jgi:hypothetical protein
MTRESEMVATNRAQTNIDLTTFRLRSFQLSFSTADIARTIFYGSHFSPPEPHQEAERGMLLVVHGNMLALEDKAFPQPAIPLTEESGLFQIINIAS